MIRNRYSSIFNHPRVRHFYDDWKLRSSTDPPGVTGEPLLRSYRGQSAAKPAAESDERKISGQFLNIQGVQRKDRAG